MDKPTLHRGRLAREPKVLSVRALTRDDLACLKLPRAPQGRVKQFRQTHHRLAKLFAAGLSRSKITEITGLSATRLYQHANDPAFQELIAQYRPEVDAEHAAEIDEFLSLGVENMIKAERQLGEHIDRAEDAGELLPVSQLLAISSDRADRFGYSKQSRQTTEVYDFAKIMEAHMSKLGKGTVLDAKGYRDEEPQQDGLAMAVRPRPAERLVPGSSNPEGRPVETTHAAGQGLRRRV